VRAPVGSVAADEGAALEASPSNELAGAS